MGLAALGALVTLVIIGLFNWKYSEPFREEVKESLRSSTTTYRSDSEVKIQEVLREKRRRRKERRERRRKLRQLKGR
jgi:hypothetical protein